MAGKFVNTKHPDSINKLVTGLQDVIKNPYYVWSNRTPTVVTYYNRNVEKSTLDEAAKIEQAPYGNNSPNTFNMIKDFFIYGIEQIQIQVENGDFGAEGGQINGEGFILPNTITPYPGDYFVINYTKDDIVFKVTGVTHDTLEDESNIYKFTYELDSIDIGDLKLNIGDTYNMMVNNVGTKFNTVIRSEKYEFIKVLDNVRSYLREHFIAVFYSDRIQSFSYLYNMRRFYDPYMVQFLIDTNILKDNDDYIYISHVLSKDSSFLLNYDRSIFKCFEDEDFKNIRRYKSNAIGRYINTRTDIFENRSEDYWEIDFNYFKLEGEAYGIIPCISEELITGIETKKLYDDEKYSIYNIIIKYVNEMNVTDKDVDTLKFFEYSDNVTLFYALPLVIYCIDNIIRKMMVKQDK